MNRIESKNYTTTFRGRAFDNVTEYSYISDESLTQEQFDTILKEEGIRLEGGWVSYLKKERTYKSGKKEYKHIAKLECSVN